MSTRDIKNAKDLDTGELIYFKGHTQATYMSDGTTVEDKLSSMKSAGYSIVNHGVDDTTFTLTPNTFHIWGAVDSLILDLGEETEGFLNEYVFQFESVGSPTSLTLPNDIKWANGVPTIKSGCIYQISIMNGMGIALSFSNDTFELTTGNSKVGDIAYWDGSKINTIYYENWKPSLGTPIGVVVIPTGFAPDGKTRIVSLSWAPKDYFNNTSSAEAEYMTWGSGTSDTVLTNYNCLPLTNNNGFANTSFDTSDGGGYAFLPSDNNFTEVASYVDPITNYSSNSAIFHRYIPSPYLGNKPNPSYYAPVTDYNNALSDFDGVGNTNTLAALNMTAAKSAQSYKVTGAEEIAWYLPSIGELGYLVVRFNKIQMALTKLIASPLENWSYHSSTESSTERSYVISSTEGCVLTVKKTNMNSFIRPFAIID